MTTVLLHSDRTGVYGAERVNHAIALGLRRGGFRVALAQPAGETPLAAELAEHGIARHLLPVENPYDAAHPAQSLVDGTSARACFAEARPDLVLFGDGFPFANLAAKQVAREMGLPYLVLVHLVRPDWAREFSPFLPGLRAAYRSAAEVVTVSGENLAALHEHFGLPEDRGRVIPNGRPAEFFAPRDAANRERLRRSWGLADDAVVAMTVGRLDVEKGYDLLLDAMPLLRKSACWGRLACVWVGAGPLESRLRALARLAGGGAIHVLGERHDVPALLDAADFLVHPSRAEGMPLAVLEAMAKGLPVLASAVGGVPEALGGTGWLLAAPEDPASFRVALADAMNTLVVDAPRREAMGLRARAHAQHHHSETRMVTDWCALVREIAGGPS